jgi:hypothetical protein
MQQKPVTTATSLRERLALGVLYLFGALIITGLAIQLYFVYCQFFKSHEENLQMANEISWKIDGRFKNSPGNIWYDADDHIWVQSVTNKVVIGKLAGNRNLEFGVKNVLEEYLQDKGYNLSSDAVNKLRVEIIYLDVLTTKKNISVFHKGEEEVIIRLKGILYKDGIKEKEIIVEESSSEISISTLLVDEGGKFNQT